MAQTFVQRRQFDLLMHYRPLHVEQIVLQRLILLAQFVDLSAQPVLDLTEPVHNHPVQHLTLLFVHKRPLLAQFARPRLEEKAAKIVANLLHQIVVGKACCAALTGVALVVDILKCIAFVERVALSRRKARPMAVAKLLHVRVVCPAHLKCAQFTLEALLDVSINALAQNLAD